MPFIKLVFPEGEWETDFFPTAITLRSIEKKGDIFSFWQRVPDIEPHYNYHMEWDQVAVLEINSFDEWWNTISRKTRNLIRKSSKSGVTITEVNPDDKFFEQIKDIFNEVPIRRGTKFRFYGMNLEEVKKMYQENRKDCIYLGAYFQNDLIGFLKLLFTDKYAYISQIFSRMSYFEKSPNNALISKAVEICSLKGVKYLVYYKMNYTSLDKFKRNNLFKEVKVPRYYIPLNLKGRIILKMKLHHGIMGLPIGILNFLRTIRGIYYRIYYNFKR